MTKKTATAEQSVGIALYSVAAHFPRQAACFQQTSSGLAAQFRELNQIIGQQRQMLSSMPAAVKADPKPSKPKKADKPA